MTRATQLEVIRTAVIKANPEIGREKWRCTSCNDQSFFGSENLHSFQGCAGEIQKELYVSRPIRLADVLLAIGRPALYDSSAYFLYKNGNEVWDLRRDDLTEQSDECVAFLADLLS